MEIFYNLIEVMVVNTVNILNVSEVYFKMVNFILCKFHLNLKKKIQHLSPRTDLTQAYISCRHCTKSSRSFHRLLDHTQTPQHDLVTSAETTRHLRTGFWDVSQVTPRVRVQQPWGRLSLAHQPLLPCPPLGMGSPAGARPHLPLGATLHRH